MKKIIISETQAPPASSKHTLLGLIDHYERSLDPWHADAMPDEFKEFGTHGKRSAGWLGIDWCGNPIFWVPDETEIEIDDDGEPILSSLFTNP